MKLNLQSISENKEQWKAAGVKLPEYDVAKARKNTYETPRWVHFGTGNIFRGYIGGICDELIAGGYSESGINAVACYDSETIDRVYKPYDCLCLDVGLKSDGGIVKKINASIGEAFAARDDLERLKEIAVSRSLQLITYTITEKGYAISDDKGFFAPVSEDMENGMNDPKTAMGMTAFMLYHRYKAGELPIAVVSLDNMSRNGDRLKASVTTIAEKWNDSGFMSYLNDSSKVSFPYSMIDKITPRPDAKVADILAADGIEDMEMQVTGKGTYIAPFVNAELPGYLVIEDAFPAGRPALEKAGVYMTDRETVMKAEGMKVGACLNPLHTALAVSGCLLGFNKISEEMKDEELKKLVYALAEENLLVASNPGIISPRAFVKEVLEERLVNPNLPDTPQRIATDTSQKIPQRFGTTMKAYDAAGRIDELKVIPLVLALYLRYLGDKDDAGNEMKHSSDPRLDELKDKLREKGAEAVLDDATLLGTDISKKNGLKDRIIQYYEMMNGGLGAVRDTLKKCL
ncbi:MAG: mannitol dehydrogenase family protein [Lachnospiraceae bacterium]|nr:mannitol dehydrogenase family protein [Lachnospiraceae bacterium]